MAYEIKVPEMGESVIEATVINWLKKPGERVAVGDAVVELETDKVTLEVNAQQAGVLQSIQHPAGENVAVGDVLGILVGEEETVAVPPSQPAETAKSDGSAGGEVAIEPATGTRATPLAQRMAEDMGINLAEVSPSGSGGRITKVDVEAFAGQAQASPDSQPAPAATVPSRTVPAPTADKTSQTAGIVPQTDRREERVRMTRRRQTIARRLVEVHQTAAMLTTFNEIDMSAVMGLRKSRREGFKQRFGVDLGYMSFFVKASIAAL